MQGQTITILEGTGIIETHLIPQLIKAGARVKLISSFPSKALKFKVAGNPGQISIIPAGNYKRETLGEALKNSDAIINLCEVKASSSQRKFIKLNVKLPILLGKLAKELTIKTVIHLSALNANKIHDYNYTYYKYKSEKTLQKEFSNSIILRPCIIFGENDNFLCNIKNIIQKTTIFPLLKQTSSNFQPIYVGDVTTVITRILLQPELYYSKTIELGGKELFSIKQIALLIAKKLNKKITFIKLPYPLLYLFSQFYSIFSSPVITKEQIQLLQQNNIIKKENNLIFIDSFHIKQYTLTDFIKINY